MPDEPGTIPRTPKRTLHRGSWFFAPWGGARLRVAAYGAVLVVLAVTVFLRARFPQAEPRADRGRKPIDPEFARSLRASFPTPTFRAVQFPFQYHSGSTGKKLVIEQTGGGAGWLDYDGDGHWDLYLVQGGDPEADDRSSQPPSQLFRNLGDGRFVEVTQSSGVGQRGYGQGVAVGDFDNDGFDDLYVTNYGRNVLYQNMGDGTFVDVTAAAGVGEVERWGTSAAWGDLDRDGDLDLYVCNYAKYDPQHPPRCFEDDFLVMCHPQRLEPEPDECYLNQGDGTFEAASQRLGTFGPENRALGVAIADFNNDRWPDIYVANDTTANFMFVNDEGHSFSESAVALGCAVNAVGDPQASMGVGVADFDHDGWLDIFLTHLSNEYDTLYHNNGDGSFDDVTVLAGLSALKNSMLGFGTVVHDFNQDTRTEIFVTNGNVDDLREKPHVDPRFTRFEMPPQMFTFDVEKGKWFDCSGDAGSFFDERRIGRGLAAADYDNDGDLDLCVVHQNSPAVLLENTSDRGHWLKLRFVGVIGNRRGIGVRARLTQGERTFHQELAGGTSYCSSHQPALIFGLGESDRECSLEVDWPGGVTQRIEGVRVDRESVIIEPAE